MTTHRAPTAEEIAEIAKAAVAHPRTVERRVLRLPVRGGVAGRVDEELRRRGLLPGDENRADAGYVTRDEVAARR